MYSYTRSVQGDKISVALVRNIEIPRRKYDFSNFDDRLNYMSRQIRRVAEHGFYIEAVPFVPSLKRCSDTLFISMEI